MVTGLEQIIGTYELLGRLHDGGMGSIFKVRHRLLGEERVVKTLLKKLANDDEFRRRFLQEARLAASLKHPNIAQIHDFMADEAGNGVIVMEFIDGVSLKAIIAGQRRPYVPLFLEIACQVLRALAFMHNKDCLHRDISPDNIMLTEDVDGKPRVKLIDLGIAKKLGSGEGLTTAGQFLGKLRYASPEHFSEFGAGGATDQSDVYSFGLVLYELLTGQPAVLGQDFNSLTAGHLFRAPQSFAATDPEGLVPEDLRAAVLRSLAKEPTERFASAAEFAQRLRWIQEQFPLDSDFNIPGFLKSIRTHQGDQGGPGTSTQMRFSELSLEATPSTKLFPGMFLDSLPGSEEATVLGSRKTEGKEDSTSTTTFESATTRALRNFSTDEVGIASRVATTTATPEDLEAPENPKGGLPTEEKSMHHASEKQGSRKSEDDSTQSLILGALSADEGSGSGSSSSSQQLPVPALFRERPPEVQKTEVHRTVVPPPFSGPPAISPEPSGRDSTNTLERPMAVGLMSEPSSPPAHVDVESLPLPASASPDYAAMLPPPSHVEPPSPPSASAPPFEFRPAQSASPPDPAVEEMPPPLPVSMAPPENRPVRPEPAPAPAVEESPVPPSVSEAPPEHRPVRPEPAPTPAVEESPSSLPGTSSSSATGTPPSRPKPSPDPERSRPLKPSPTPLPTLTSKSQPSSVPQKQTHRRRPSTSKGPPPLFIALALIIALAGMAWFAWQASKDRSPVPLQPPVNQAPSPPTNSGPHPRIAEAQDCLIAGNPVCAQKAVDALFAEAVELTAGDEKILVHVRAEIKALEGSGKSPAPPPVNNSEDLGVQLAAALADGPITELREKVEAIKTRLGEGPQAHAGYEEDFARAEEIVGVYLQLLRHQSTGKYLSAIQQALRLGKIYPPYDAASDLETAARAVERQADDLANKQDLAGARQRLKALQKYFPARAGVRDRLATVARREQETEQAAMGDHFMKVEQALIRRDPGEGLKLLEEIKAKMVPNSQYQKRYDRLLERVQRQKESSGGNPR